MSTPTDDDWEALRTHFDNLGMTALEKVVKEGTPPEVAGARIAEFNDMLIARLKEKMGTQDA